MGILQRPYGIYTQLCRYQIIRSICKNVISGGMNLSNIMGSADTSVVAASKNKWKLTDSLKDKIAEMAKKDAQNNEYMGNEFKSLRKSEISKVAPDRAALIGKFSYLTGSGNASVMKEVRKQIKDGCACYLESRMRQNVREKALVQQFMYIMKTEKRYLHIQALLAGEAKETKAETKVNSALKQHIMKLIRQKERH